MTSSRIKIIFSLDICFNLLKNPVVIDSNFPQNFEFSLAPGDSGRIECTQGVVVGPKPYKIAIRTRF